MIFKSSNRNTKLLECIRTRLSQGGKHVFHDIHWRVISRSLLFTKINKIINKICPFVAQSNIRVSPISKLRTPVSRAFFAEHARDIRGWPEIPASIIARVPASTTIIARRPLSSGKQRRATRKANTVPVTNDFSTSPSSRKGECGSTTSGNQWNEKKRGGRSPPSMKLEKLETRDVQYREYRSR